MAGPQLVTGDAQLHLQRMVPAQDFPLPVEHEKDGGEIFQEGAVDDLFVPDGLFRLLALGDVIDREDEARDLAAVVLDRRAVDRQLVAPTVRPVDRVLHVEDWGAGGQHPAEGLQLVRQRAAVGRGRVPFR
jgi:hypothetical protein